MLPDLYPSPFSIGQRPAQLLGSGAPEFEGFSLFGADGEDYSSDLLNAEELVWVLVRDVFEIKAEHWAELLPLLQDLDRRSVPYAVISGSDESDLLPMRNVSGLLFSYYLTDPDYLVAIEQENIALIAVKDAQITGRWSSGNLPEAGTVLAR